MSLSLIMWCLDSMLIYVFKHCQAGDSFKSLNTKKHTPNPLRLARQPLCVHVCLFFFFFFKTTISLFSSTRHLAYKQSVLAGCVVSSVAKPNESPAPKTVWQADAMVGHSWVSSLQSRSWLTLSRITEATALGIGMVDPNDQGHQSLLVPFDNVFVYAEMRVVHGKIST